MPPLVVMSANADVRLPMSDLCSKTVFITFPAGKSRKVASPTGATHHVFQTCRLGKPDSCIRKASFLMTSNPH